MIDQNRHHVVPGAQSLVLCALKISRVKDLKHCQNIQRAWRQSILLHDNWQEIAEAQDSHENMHDKKTPYSKRKQDSTAIQSVCHQHAPQKKNQAHHHRKSTYRYIETHESAVNGYHPKIYKTPQLDPLIHLRFQQKKHGSFGSSGLPNINGEHGNLPLGWQPRSL